MAAAHVCVPRVSHSCSPPASPGDLPHPKIWETCQSPIKVWLLPPRPGAQEIPCVPFKGDVFPPSPVELPKLSLAGLQSQMLGGMSA